MAEAKRFFAPVAWVQGRWARDVLLTVGDDGRWANVQARAAPQQRESAVQLDGPVLPGLVNAHSHAFQRAIAGLTENRSTHGQANGQQENFWSWRDRMYSAANRITPEQLEAVATFLYAELLAGGYTQVCEFHYLHHQPGGEPYAEPVELALALARAAQRVGMGLTLLPTLYMRSGFGATGLRHDQRRFGSTPAGIWDMVQDLRRQLPPNCQVGVAVHSLRAAGKHAIKELTSEAQRAGLPVHIHIAEQTQEVDDCITHTGLRPIEWLLQHLPVNAQWSLVHATHATDSELQAVRESSASVVICPSTEANLGDGVFDFASHVAGNGVPGRWSIGSDSHVSRAWPGELRLLEYGLRLTQHKRNVAAHLMNAASTGAALFDGALAGGPAAAGLPLGGLQPGQRADFVVLQPHAPALLGVPAQHLLDALVFSSPTEPFRQVYVAGQLALGDGAAWDWRAVGQDYAQAMRQLWAA